MNSEIKHTNDKTLYWLETQLLQWFETNGRTHLPWRETGIGAYEIWLSEIMLQQTQVSRVIPYFDRMIERFPTVETLAQVSWEEFFPYYAGLGYYRRGRNMLLTAQKVVSDHQGVFPQTEAELRALPGIGPYTARAILSFAYHEPRLAFDTNHQRVFGRYLEGNKTARLEPESIERSLTNFHDLNAAIMDFANEVCVTTPRCFECPLQQKCQYFQTGGKREPIVIKKKSTFPRKSAQTVLVLHRDHQEYFSAQSKSYTPFILPSPLNTRASIKSYFNRTYNLDLAIRPPHLLGYIDEKPTMFMNAQVLLGEHSFSSFPKSELESWQAALPFVPETEKFSGKPEGEQVQ